MSKDYFKYCQMPAKKVTKPGDKWFVWPKCQSINVSLTRCEDKAEVELHAPSPDGGGGWLILYLCKVCLGRYDKLECDEESYLIEHRISNEVIVYEAIDE